jgi:hypothetical protein
LKPQLLGYIFDILVKILRVKNNKKDKENDDDDQIDLRRGYPRMADFAEIAEIISRSMGYPDNKFLDAYYKNMGLQTEQALEASPVATAIIEFMDSRNEWIGTVTELLYELEEIAQTLKVNTKNNSNNKQWPGAPNSLSRKINEVTTNLREIGIIIERPLDTRTNTRLVKICKISPESPDIPGRIKTSTI